MAERRAFRVGPPWLLPLILAILIAVIVGAVIYGRNSGSSSSPTATPVPPTSTPATGGTPGTQVPATATPSGGTGKSTPLPGATPVPTIPGLTLGEIQYTQNEVQTIQSGANQGNSRYTYYRDPRQVVQNDLPHYGFTKPFEIVAPNPSPTPTPYIGQDKRPLVKFIVNYQSKTFTVFTAQAATQGPRGIWLIVTILPGRQ